MPESVQEARLHIRVKDGAGVGFRAHVEYAARQLGVNAGSAMWAMTWSRAVAEGERAKLERLAEAVKTGPRGSHVTNPPSNGSIQPASFSRSPSAEHLKLAARVRLRESQSPLFHRDVPPPADR